MAARCGPGGSPAVVSSPTEALARRASRVALPGIEGNRRSAGRCLSSTCSGSAGRDQDKIAAAAGSPWCARELRARGATLRQGARSPWPGRIGPVGAPTGSEGLQAGGRLAIRSPSISAATCAAAAIRPSWTCAPPQPSAHRYHRPARRPEAVRQLFQPLDQRSTLGLVHDPPHGLASPGTYYARRARWSQPQECRSGWRSPASLKAARMIEVSQQTCSVVPFISPSHLGRGALRNSASSIWSG